MAPLITDLQQSQPSETCRDLLSLGFGHLCVISFSPLFLVVLFIFCVFVSVLLCFPPPWVYVCQYFSTVLPDSLPPAPRFTELSCFSSAPLHLVPLSPFFIREPLWCFRPGSGLPCVSLWLLWAVLSVSLFLFIKDFTFLIFYFWSSSCRSASPTNRDTTLMSRPVLLPLNPGRARFFKSQ